MILTGFVAARPLDPSPDEARSWVRRELVNPEYVDEAWLTRLIDWFVHQFDRSVDAASELSQLSVFAAMLIAVVLIGGLAWLASRARRSVSSSASEKPAWRKKLMTAGQLRARAQAALVDGRHEEALTDGFRALALRQVERGRLESAPGMTARELARSLGGEYPQHRSRVEDSAELFDSVVYGDRPASRDQAVAVLELDDELGTR